MDDFTRFIGDMGTAHMKQWWTVHCLSDFVSMGGGL